MEAKAEQILDILDPELAATSEEQAKRSKAEMAMIKAVQLRERLEWVVSELSGTDLESEDAALAAIKRRLTDAAEYDNLGY